MNSRFVIPLMLALAALAVGAFAGPYAPAAGVPGSTAVSKDSTALVAWAAGVTAYTPGTECLPQWRDVSKALGSATNDPYHITCLGNGGSITLNFNGHIVDGPGADFAIFENGVGNGFLELAYVEVSSDGVNFIRLPNASLTAAPVPSFGTIDPTNIQGLGSKYRQGFGEPFDLASVGLTHATHVRLVDVIGDGSYRDTDNRIIYDPNPTVQSGGFDLDAIGVMHFSPWLTLAAGAFTNSGTNASALAHLPDGRFVLGVQGRLYMQNAWAAPALTQMLNGGVLFDPSFIAVRDGSQALLGTGGASFTDPTGVKLFNPATPAVPVQSTSLASLQNFTGVYWRSSVSSREGWIIGGANGPTFGHTLSFISTDGSVSGIISDEICSYSSGIAVDAAGNVYAGLFEVGDIGPIEDTNKVLRFPVAQVDAAVASLGTGSPVRVPRAAGVAVYQFDGTSTIAVDGLGRVWAAGYETQQVQVFDPATGGMRRLTPDHPAISGSTDVLYQVRSFERNGEPYVAFLAQDEGGGNGRPIYYGQARARDIIVPASYTSWTSSQFGAGNVIPANEATLWGDLADPDQDRVPNLLEYAFGHAPQGVTQDELLQPGREDGRASITFRRRPAALDLRYFVEVSSTLAPGSWATLAISEAGAVTAAVAEASAVEAAGMDGTIAVTVSDLISQSTASGRFLRVRVERITTP
jgi:hypothetical protein